MWWGPPRWGLGVLVCWAMLPSLAPRGPFWLGQGLRYPMSLFVDVWVFGRGGGWSLLVPLVYILSSVPSGGCWMSWLLPLMALAGGGMYCRLAHAQGAFCLAMHALWRSIRVGVDSGWRAWQPFGCWSMCPYWYLIAIDIKYWLPVWQGLAVMGHK